MNIAICDKLRKTTKKMNFNNLEKAYKYKQEIDTIREITCSCTIKVNNNKGDSIEFDTETQDGDSYRREIAHVLQKRADQLRKMIEEL